MLRDVMSQSEPVPTPARLVVLEALRPRPVPGSHHLKVPAGCWRPGSGAGPWGLKAWKSSTGLDLPSSGAAAPDVVTTHQSQRSLQEVGVIGGVQGKSCSELTKVTGACRGRRACIMDGP